MFFYFIAKAVVGVFHQQPNHQKVVGEKHQQRHVSFYNPKFLKTIFAEINLMTPEREEKIISVLKKRQPDFTLVFENVWDPHNISAVLRTADAVGIMEVFIIYTQHQKSTKLGRRSSSSAKKWIKPRYFYSVDECFTELRKKYDKIYCTHLGESSKSLYEIDFTERVALVFGNESVGVSEEVLNQCDGNFMIPMQGMVQSLNISVACAVSIYEAMRQRLNKGMYKESRIPDHEYVSLLKEWKEKNYSK